jgi:hypothetical protein
MFERLVIEAEKSGDSRSLFRLQVDGHLIGKGLTVGQAQLLLREVLDRSNPRSPPARRTAAPGVRLRKGRGHGELIPRLPHGRAEGPA